MDGDDKPEPTEMDKLIAALSARSFTMDGKPITAEMVLPLVLGLVQENGELKTTIRVLRKLP